jgi:hypothetical protein
MFDPPKSFLLGSRQQLPVTDDAGRGVCMVGIDAKDNQTRCHRTRIFTSAAFAGYRNANYLSFLPEPRQGTHYAGIVA